MLEQSPNDICGVLLHIPPHEDECFAVRRIIPPPEHVPFGTAVAINIPMFVLFYAIYSFF